MIKNLQHQLNEAGKIKIGEKGKMITSSKGNEFRPPKKLDHFRLTTTEKNEDGDYIIDKKLTQKIKDAGSGYINSKGELIAIPIRLVYNDIESNFPHRYVSYVSGKLACHGDGEKALDRINNFEKEKNCPCQKLENNKCKPTGKLTCVIDEAGLFGQAHVFNTTSINSIKGIVGGMELLLKATGGKIAWLPLMLTLNQKNTTTPEGINTTVYIVSLCFRGNTEALRGEVLKLIETDKRYLLDMVEADKNPIPAIDTEDEQDFVDEFFPTESDKSNSVEIISETIDTPKTENFLPPEDAQLEDKDYSSLEIPDDIKAKLIKPEGETLTLYKRFLLEDTYDKAYALAKRLKVGHLMYYLVKNHPDIFFEAKMQKSVILEIITEILNKKFNNVSEDASSEPSKKTETEDPPPEYKSEWDDSGPITPDQCRMLVKQKGQLEKLGKLKSTDWIKHVNFFTDINGEKIDKAVNLTVEQGYTFITMLDAEIVKRDDIPF